MKFDCIIMNPPYQKNLHLKILAETIKHLKDDGTCVNLSPVRWLQDPLTKYKKNCDLKRFETRVVKHIEQLEIIDCNIARILFNINIFNDLGIYKLVKNITSFDIYQYCTQTILNIECIYEKIYNYAKNNNLHHHLDNGLEDGIRVKMSAITGRGGEADKLSFYGMGVDERIFEDGFYKNTRYAELCGGIKKFNAKKSGTEIKLPLTIKFTNIVEAKNFIKSVKTKFIIFCNIATKNDMHPQFKFLPWLGDAVNPRTGLKGYKGEWTDSDFYSFFNITPEEQKTINETLAKYK